MSFITRPDYSNNRQIKQFELTSTQLSGTTVFGIDDAYIPEGLIDSTVNINALQNIQTIGLIFPNSIPEFTGTTYQLLGRDNTTGKMVEVTGLSGGTSGTTATGLELINEGSSGWRYVGKDTANYGDIGANATDISRSTGASSTVGSTGADSFTYGIDNENPWASTFMGGQDILDISSGATNFSAANIIVGAEHEIGNSPIGNAVFGERSTLSAPNTNYNTQCTFLSLMAGGKNDLYAGHGSAQIGDFLLGGAPHCTIVGTANIDETITVAANSVSGLGTSNNPRFIVGTGTFTSYSSASGIVRNNGFVVWGDGGVYAPMMTTDFISGATSDVLITKGYADVTYSGGTADGSETKIQGFGDIDVTGSGTTVNPYLVGYKADIPVPIMRYIKITLTSGDTQNLFSIPITAVVAPGANKAIEVFTAAARLRYGSVAFDGNSELEISCSGATNNQYRTDNTLLDDTTDNFIILQRKFSTTTPQIIENDSLVIRGTADSTVGNSEVDVYITYRIIDL
jgi:hypothetical protein